MPARPKAEQLPDDIREELEQKLIASNFSDYRALESWLAEQGFEITKSSLQRWGSKLEERLHGIKVATEQAKAICAASPDDDGAMSDALMRLVQEKLFQLLLNLEVDPDSIELPKLTRAIADICRGTVTLKKYQGEVRSKMKAAAAEVRKLATDAGVSEETMLAIDARLQGVV